ncbi:hypothetical protein CHUAL_008566 [Chamberlinius hualienensis]
MIILDFSSVSAMMMFAFSLFSVMWAISVISGHATPISGSKLKLAVYHDPPYVIFDHESNALTGFDVEVVNILANHLNFSYSFKVVSDGYGVLLPNGTWTGIIGLIQRKVIAPIKEVDMCLPTLTLTSKRSKLMDMSISVSRTYARFVAKKNSPQMIDWDTYLSPFTNGVWMYVIIFSVLCYAGVYLSLYVAYRRQMTSKDLFTFWSFMSRKNEEVRGIFSLRLFALSFAILLVVLCGCYNSTLVAYLTVDTNKLPFSTLEDLIVDKDYQVGFIKGSAYDEMLQLVPKYGRGNGYKLFNKIMSNPSNLVADNREGVLMAFNQKYVFLSWIDGIITELRQSNYDACQFVFMKGKFWMTEFGIPLQKNSSYTQPISMK